MPISKIIIEIIPSDDKKKERIIKFDNETKQWTSNDGAFFPSEIKLIKDIDTARMHNMV